MSPASLQQLKTAYDRSADYSAYLGEQAGEFRAIDYSEFWLELFGDAKRRNYPAFNEMLVMRRGFTYPLADRAKTEDTEAEEAYARAAWDVVTRSMDPAHMRAFEESAIGVPTAFEFDGRMLSAGGIVNALTTQRVVEATAHMAGRPLRILEIGPGYGQVAHQLFQRVDIATYAICDLPQNLFLCSFYLQANAPERTTHFVRADGEVDSNAGLVFCVPPFLERIEGEFDLVLNSYSFQEMNAESVHEYFEFASKRLSPDGVLYSLNSHAKAGIESAGDYRVELFELASFSPQRRFPFQLFATSPYELVLRRGSSGDAVKQAVDRLGNLVQLGCSDEIADACTLLSDGRAAEALAALDGSASVGAYVRGCEAMAADEYEAAQRELEAALPGLGESAAHVRALTMLAALAHVRRDDAGRAALTDRAKAITPHLEQEIDQFSRNPALCGELLASTLLPGRGEGPRNARLRHARDSLKRAGARLRTGSVTTGPGNGSTDPGGPH